MSPIYWIISLISILPLCLGLAMRLGAKNEKLGSGGSAADGSSSSQRSGSGDASTRRRGRSQHGDVSCVAMVALKRDFCSTAVDSAKRVCRKVERGFLSIYLSVFLGD